MDKLGQLLVARGWVTAQQLSRALRNQNVTGGHLGTCLLEMDAISEDLLLKALSEQVGVPAATIEDLRAIPQEVAALLPAKLAVRCRAVPFRASIGRIDVAMLDPRDLTSQDELAFASGRRVKAHVAHEARIHEALDRSYGEECPSRFVHLLDRLNRARFFWERGAAAGTAGAGAAAPATPATHGTPETPRRAAPLLDLPLAPPRRAAAAAREAAVAAAERAPRPTPPTPPRAIALTPEERAALGSTGTGPAAPPPTPPAPRATSATPGMPPRTQQTPAPLPRPAAPSPAVPASLDEVEAAFASIFDRDEVARILINFMARSYRRVALFQVGRGRVTGWTARGQAIDRERIAGFSIGLDQPSVFLNLAQGSGLHLGPLPAMPAHRELALAWGGELPAECVMVPVRIKDRLVTVIYADGGGGKIRADLEGLRRLAAATAAAFERCILHKKHGGGAAE